MFKNSMAKRAQSRLVALCAAALAIAATTLATAPAAAAESSEPGDDLVDRLPAEGRVVEGGPSLDADPGVPTVLMSLEGSDVDEHIQYDLSQVSDETYDKLLEIAPMAKPDEPGQISPQLSIGLGWAIYIYVNQSDIDVILTGGGASFGGAICAALGGGIWGAAACATAGGLIANQVPDALPPGHCAEFAFGYTPVVTLLWWDIVPMTC